MWEEILRALGFGWGPKTITPPPKAKASDNFKTAAGYKSGQLAEEYSTLMLSPLVDSLSSLSSHKNLNFIPHRSNQLGAYDNRFPWNIDVNINPNSYPAKPEQEYASGYASTNFTPRRILQHEYGHAISDTPEFQNLLNFFGAKTSPIPFGPIEKDKPESRPVNVRNREFNRRSPLQRRAELEVDPYYRAGGHEAFAQAFANAHQFLAETAKNSDMNYRKFIGDLEANTPGMGLIVVDLLKQPLYAKHPLRKIFNPN